MLDFSNGSVDYIVDYKPAGIHHHHNCKNCWKWMTFIFISSIAIIVTLAVVLPPTQSQKQEYAYNPSSQMSQFYEYHH